MTQHSENLCYKIKTHTNNSVLDVIAVISNPSEFKMRYKLFNEFCERMKLNPKVRLTTLELQQRARPFQTNADIKLNCTDILWYKENMINVAVQYLPSDWEYMAYIDSDLIFQNQNWAEETILKLQIHPIVQCFSHAIDLGHNGEALQTHIGFAYQYVNNETWKPAGYGKFFHSGYAWAMRRSAYDALGGLLEIGILGSGDAHMALSLIGMVDKSLNHKLSKHYKQICLNWQERAERHIKRDIGFVRGTILHEFHGCKTQRQYKDRWNILVNNKFDPLMDIKKDCHGLWQLEDNKPVFRDELRMYFNQRNEDSIDLFQDYPNTKRSFIGL